MILFDGRNWSKNELEFISGRLYWYSGKYYSMTFSVNDTKRFSIYFSEEDSKQSKQSVVDYYMNLDIDSEQSYVDWVQDKRHIYNINIIDDFMTARSILGEHKTLNFEISVLNNDVYFKGILGHVVSRSVDKITINWGNNIMHYNIIQSKQYKYGWGETLEVYYCID